MKRDLCDLHAHSMFSDGTYTPEELIAEAERAGLSAVALTDHNTVSGLPAFLAAAEGSSVRAIPGIEISSDYGQYELHIVGLFVNPEAYDAIREKVSVIRENKKKSNQNLVVALRAAGYDVDYDDLCARVPGGVFNRSLVGEALMEKGYVSSVSEAFDTILSKKHGIYKEPRRLPVFEVIGFLRSIGAVPVIAHPFLSIKDENDLRTFLGEAVEHGLCGMETRYSTYDEETAAKAAALAAEFGLLHSGGSDFHGGRKPGIYLGAGYGTLEVPVEFLEELEQKKDCYEN